MKTIKFKLATIFILIILIICAVFILLTSPIKEEVILEAGNTLTLDLFMKKDHQDLKWDSDITTIDTSIVGEYEINIKYKDRTYTSLLIIQDTTAPSALSHKILTAVNILPNALDCVKDIVDVSDVNATYKEEVDVSSIGIKNVIIVLEDAYGNVSEVESSIEVIEDHEAPEIFGTKNIFVSIGDTISYRDGVTVSDNCDQNVKLTFDTSGVNLDKEGIYTVTYQALDASGNKTEKTIKVIVEEKSVTKDMVYKKCDEILASITNENMSQMEIAFEIYKWTKTHIGYANSTEKSSWVKGAYQGLFKHQGDCYTYFATCKALLTRAGIDNIDIERNKIKVQRHYWSLINIGDGWYHVDATPRLEEGDNFFMCTTEDLRLFKKGTHRFDQSLYPEISTKSIQHLIDYEKGIILKD